MKRIVFLMILLAVCWVFPPGTPAAEPVGSVTFVTGRVDVTRPGQAAEPLVKGTDIYEGDIIRTKTGAKAEITFIDESIVRVAQKSRLKVTEYMYDRQERRSTLSLFRGKIQSLVKKLAGFSFGLEKRNRFEVHTPTAVCGVRGTNFFTWYMNGQTGTAFKEGQGYIYPANNPNLGRMVNTNEAGYVADPNAAPVVKPATDADLEQHLEDTMPTEGEDSGDSGDQGDAGDGGTELTTGGDTGTGDTGTGDTGDTGDTGILTNDDKTILDLREETRTGVILFSGEASIGFLSSGTLSGETDDLLGQGPMTLEGLLSGSIGTGVTSTGAVGGSMTLPDETEVGAFEGNLAGVGGSWEGLLVSFYAQEPEVASGNTYNVGYLYGALSSGADYSGAAAGSGFSAAGTAYRSGALGQVELVPYTDPVTGEVDTLQDTLADQFNVPSLSLPAATAGGTLTAGRPVTGSVGGSLTTLATNSGRVLGIYADGSYSGYSNPDGLASWTSIYGYDGGSYYFLGSLSGSDDMAYHIAYNGNLTYMDANYLGNVNLWSRATDYEGLGIVSANATTFDPLAYSGTWGGATVYENSGGTFSPFATDSGIIGGRTPGELLVYGQFAGAPSFAPDEKFLYNSDISVSGAAMDLTGASAGIWKMQGNAAYGPNQINYGLINGQAVALFRNPATGQIGLMASKDISGRFYPSVYDPAMEATYSNIEMFNLVGTWGASSTEDGAAYPSTGSGPMAAVSMTGDFNGSGMIEGGMDSGYTRYFSDGYGGSPGWGIYNLKLGDGTNLAYRDTAETGWQAKIGGQADFGTGTTGYFLADASGTWTMETHSQITGNVLGTFMSSTHLGQLTGPFYGTNFSEVAPIPWIGQSIGIYQGTDLAWSGSLAAEIWEIDPLSSPASGIQTGYGDGIVGYTGLPWAGAPGFKAMGDSSGDLGGGGSGLVTLFKGETSATGATTLAPAAGGRLDLRLAGLDRRSSPPTGVDTMSGSVYGLYQTPPDAGGLSSVGLLAGTFSATQYDALNIFSGDSADLAPLGSARATGLTSTALTVTSPSGSYLNAAGGFNETDGSLSGTISGSGAGLFSHLFYNSDELESLPWGTYDLMLDTGSYDNPNGRSTFSTVVGGDARFTVISGSAIAGGLFLASVDGGISGEELTGAVGATAAPQSFGYYLDAYQMGKLSGDFYGVRNDSGGYGGWIGESVGTFQGSRVDFSGQWGPMLTSLYYNDTGNMVVSGEDHGNFGVKKYADGHTEFLAIGDFTDAGYGGRYLWNTPVSGQQLVAVPGGADTFNYSTVFEGFTGGLWLRDAETAPYGKLANGVGWFLVLDDGGNGSVMRADLSGGFFDMPLPLSDGMWYAKSDAVQSIVPNADAQFTSAISGASLQTGGVGIGMMGASFAGDGFSGFRGEVLPAGGILYLNHPTEGDLPWGVYDLKLGAGGRYTRRPAGNASWSGVIAGGDAYFDGSGGGIFIASAAGTWNDDGEIVGKVGVDSTAAGAFGKYMTLYQVGGFSDTGGGIGGDFSGINTSEGFWIGQSTGMFSGKLLDMSGYLEGGDWDVGGYGGFTSSGNLAEGLLGTTADPAGGAATLYVIGYNGVRSPITSLAAAMQSDHSGRQYFTLLDLYSSGTAALSGYAAGLYADGSSFGYTDFSGISGTHYGNVAVFDAEGQISLGAVQGIYSGLVSSTVSSDMFTLSTGSRSFMGSVRGELYSFDYSTPGVHRTLGFGPTYSGPAYTDMYWAMNSIGRYSEPDGVYYEGPGSHAELYYLAVNDTGDETGTGIMGRLGGEISGGSPGSSLAIAGAPAETPLEGWTYWGQGYGGTYYGSLHHYDNLYVGEDTGIIGGYNSGGQLKYLAMGEFDVQTAYSVVNGMELVWATPLFQSEFDGTYWTDYIQGFTGGIFNGGNMDGKIFAVIDRIDEGMGAGILLADVFGNYSEFFTDGTYNYGGWLASGDTAWIPMATTLPSWQLANDYPVGMEGGGASYPSGATVSVTAGQLTSANFIDQHWGVWGVHLYGTHSGADFTAWHLSLTNTDPQNPLWAEVSGGRTESQNPGVIEGRAAGGWVDLDSAMTGVFGGPVKGTFDPTRWQAVAGGAFMNTEKFMSMVQNNPGALDQLNIPRFEVGRTDLSWADAAAARLTSVNMNDVIFFAHSTGAMPSIWATSNVNGTYNGVPQGGDSVSLSGSGFSSVGFTVDNFTAGSPNRWGALVNGSGTVPGTTHSVDIQGGAAGTFGGGNFNGTGAGVAKPAAP